MLWIEGPQRTTHVVLRTEPLGAEAQLRFVREVRALALAEDHALAAPRLLAADLDGSETGHLATIVTALPGRSSPQITDPEQLRAYGAAVASLTYVQGGLRDGLPLLDGPIDIDHAARDRRGALRYEHGTASERSAMINQVCADSGMAPAEAERSIIAPKGGRSKLLESAEARLALLPEPAADPVLVHGDLHLGNTLWIGHHLIGMVDWDAAGIGHPGIDLGLARFDADLHVDHELIDPATIASEVLAGWQQVTRVRLDEATVAYWDVRAALNAPCEFGPKDGSEPARRDRFLRSALDQL
ncbi:phosphotransferase [Microlunatus sp. GCM10028923]|uniref:phosphotransferase n=1 Tax=Microlunatus sp. GCM10028923 TaxID=3273400 RepID=UPI00360FDA81